MKTVSSHFSQFSTQTEEVKFFLKWPILERISTNKRPCNQVKFKCASLPVGLFHCYRILLKKKSLRSIYHLTVSLFEFAIVMCQNKMVLVSLLLPFSYFCFAVQISKDPSYYTHVQDSNIYCSKTSQPNGLTKQQSHRLICNFKYTVCIRIQLQMML